LGEIIKGVTQRADAKLKLFVKKFIHLVSYFSKNTANKNQNCKSKQFISGKGYLSIFVAQIIYL